MNLAAFRSSRPAARWASRSALCLNLTTLAVMATFGTAYPVMALAQEAATQFDLPAQSLDDALIQLGRQTSLQFFYTPEVVAGVRAPRVQGSMTPEDALKRLLQGTPVQYRRDGRNATLSRSMSTTELAPVTVVGNAGRLMPAYAGGQVATGGRVGMLGDKDFMETPFSVTSYTSQTITNLQAKTVADVLINDPSVGVETSTGHWLGNFNIRGFTVQSNDTTINGIGGLHAQNIQMPIEFVERVDVLRGPSALLSGITPNGTIGGQINIETKRAATDPITRVGVGYTSDSTFGTHVDIGRRWGEKHQWGVRINGSVEDGDKAVDDLSAKRYFGSIGLDYAGDRFRLGLDAYTVDEKARGGVPLMARVVSTSIPDAPANTTNAFKGAAHDAEAHLVMMQGEYDLTDNWSIKAGTGRSVGKSYGFSTGNYVNLLDGDGNYSAQNWDTPSRKESTVWFAGLQGNFSTAGISHQLTANFQRISIDNFYHGGSSPAWSGNIYDPVAPPYDAPTLGSPPKTAETVLDGFALADTLGFWDDRFLLTLGARHQRVKVENFNGATGAKTSKYDESATTPMVAVVGKLTSNWSLYANYAEGLSQGTTVGDTYLNAGEVFKPYKSKQYEAGIKWDGGTFANTLSVFQLTRPSGISDNSTSPLPTYRMDGEQRNRGVEWQFFGEPFEWVRVLGGVVYTQAELTRTQGGLTDGNTALGVPKWRATLGLEYDVPALEGLTLSGRWTHASSQYVNATNTMKLDAWNRFDVGARYSTKINGRNVNFYANVENVTNKSYWESATARAIILNSPRVFKLSATIDF